MIRVVHPGSQIRMLTFSYPGSRVKKAPNPGSRIRIRNTVNRPRHSIQTCQKLSLKLYSTDLTVAKKYQYLYSGHHLNFKKCMEPVLWIGPTDFWIRIRILLFSSVTDKMPAKKVFYYKFLLLIIFLRNIYISLQR
jgi:hypothetical protein